MKTYADYGMLERGTRLPMPKGAKPHLTRETQRFKGSRLGDTPGIFRRIPIMGSLECCRQCSSRQAALLAEAP